MIKLFFSLQPFAFLRDHARLASTHYLLDPLSHPALERMSERELADLPLDARLFHPSSKAGDDNRWMQTIS